MFTSQQVQNQSSVDCGNDQYILRETYRPCYSISASNHKVIGLMILDRDLVILRKFSQQNKLGTISSQLLNTTLRHLMQKIKILVV